MARLHPPEKRQGPSAFRGMDPAFWGMRCCLGRFRRCLWPFCRWPTSASCTYTFCLQPAILLLFLNGNIHLFLTKTQHLTHLCQNNCIFAGREAKRRATGKNNCIFAFSGSGRQSAQRLPPVPGSPFLHHPSSITSSVRALRHRLIPSPRTSSTRPFFLLLGVEPAANNTPGPRTCLTSLRSNQSL